MSFFQNFRNYIFYHAVYAGVFNGWTDEKYLRMLIRRNCGYELNLDDPKTFNEKQQWLKLYDRRPIYTTMVDKCDAKGIIAEKVGDRYVVPTLAVWDRVEDINLDVLPNSFVLKTTHDCGGVVICRDKASFDFKAAKKHLKKHFNTNYYLTSREWPYKNVKPRIIAEKLLGEGKDELRDYKLMCFNGKVQCTTVCTDRFAPGGVVIIFYDKDWNLLPVTMNTPKKIVKTPKPKHYDEMVAIAEKLSAGFPFLRVDLYEDNDRIFVGELTLFPGSGFDTYDPPEWARTLGDMITLPSEKTLAP